MDSEKCLSLKLFLSRIPFGILMTVLNYSKVFFLWENFFGKFSNNSFLFFSFPFFCSLGNRQRKFQFTIISPRSNKLSKSNNLDYVRPSCCHSVLKGCAITFIAFLQIIRGVVIQSFASQIKEEKSKSFCSRILIGKLK